MKSGNLNFLEPSGPLQACNGSALPLPSPYLYLSLLTTVDRSLCSSGHKTQRTATEPLPVRCISVQLKPRFLTGLNENVSIFPTFIAQYGYNTTQYNVLYPYCAICILIVVYVRVFLLFVHVFLLSMHSYCCLCILIVVHVFLSLSMYSYCCLCILIVVYVFLLFVHVFLLFVHVFLSLSVYSYRCPCILIVVYVYLLLSMYSYRCLCILIVVYVFLLFVHVF